MEAMNDGTTDRRMGSESVGLGAYISKEESL